MLAACILSWLPGDFDAACLDNPQRAYRVSVLKEENAEEGTRMYSRGFTCSLFLLRLFWRQTRGTGGADLGYTASVWLASPLIIPSLISLAEAKVFRRSAKA